MDDHLDGLHRLLVEVLRWRHQGSVTRVNAGVLHVLRNGDGHHHAVTGYGINVDLLKRGVVLKCCSKAPQLQDLLKIPNLGLLDKFGDDDRVFFGHGYGAAQVPFKVRVAVGHIHGSTTENVGGTDQTGITDRLTKLHRRLQREEPQCRTWCFN